MADVCSLLKLEADEKKIQLTYTFEKKHPHWIKTDSLRLRQILLNVVGNAVKFTETGSVHIDVKMSVNRFGEPRVMFIVKDTGRGITQEQSKKLFAPFSQADPSTTRKFGGTGLGLILSKKLALALGGDVVLDESLLGRGSTFVITIDPGIPDKSFAEDKKIETPVQAPSLTDLSKSLSHLKILVVDDSLDNQTLIKRMLRLSEASVETANNGREGLDKAIAGNFDIVFMDLQMPVMDGFEATRTLRARGYKKPIIALTAHAMNEDRRRSLDGGFDEHISKPIDRKILQQVLVRCSGVT